MSGGVPGIKNNLNPNRFTTSRLVQDVVKEDSSPHSRYRAIAFINKNELTENDIRLLRRHRQKVLEEI